jgi:excisionase family DNA binding protein
MKTETVTGQPADGRPRLTISLEDAAWRLSVSPSFLRLEISRGSIKPVRLGRRVLISEAEIERYLAEHTDTASGGSGGEEKR